MTPADWKRRVEVLEAKAAAAVGGPAFVEIENDPERRKPGNDMAEVGGQTYERGEDEDKPAFYARLRDTAVAVGQKLILISLAQDYGLDDYVVDVTPGGTIEIGTLTQEGR
jgi:hypothetical protein